jgi:hypothetical protein
MTEEQTDARPSVPDGLALPFIDVTVEKATAKTSLAREITLGDVKYELRRMTTANGLGVAKAILQLGSSLADIVEEGMGLQRQIAAEDETGAVVAAGLNLLEKVVPLIDENDLINLAAKIIGQPPSVVADAPMEDVLNAIADAFEINDMPALIKAAQRIYQNVQRYTGGNN